ncbi:MAG: ATP-dependent DNA ligase [Spirochaetota bacterium]
MVQTKFSKLAEIFARLEKTASSLAMVDILADFFPKISPEEAKISAYLLRGELTPPYEGLEIGLADKMVIRAIALGQKSTNEKIESLFNKAGDLGSVVETLKAGNKGKGLTIKEVFEKLTEIAKMGGTGSQEKKVSYLADLISKVSGEEARYIVRTILGTLRLGVGEMTFLYGLAKAFSDNSSDRQANKKNKEILEYAFNVISDLGEVAYAVSTKYAELRGLDADSRGRKIEEMIKKVEPKVGVPIRMMLSNRVEELKEIQEHILGEVSVEDKYDGERIQAHILPAGKRRHTQTETQTNAEEREVILFSRRQENITHQYPDVINGLKKSFKGKEAIMEGEVVPFDEKSGKQFPFQVLMSRRRKYNIEEYVKKIPVKYFLFDLLYLDGHNFLGKSLEQRKLALKNSFAKSKIIEFAEGAITEDLTEIKKRFEDSMKRGNEGIMIKDYSGIYQAGSRGWLWIKFKKDYQKEIVDTFDLAVVGALYGTGRRAKTYGSLLVAAYNSKTNKYYSFTKVGTGFTDETLAELPKMLDKYKLKEKSKLLETGMKMDVWFEPKIVLEISGAEITVSPVHMVAEDKVKQGGLALRFPRFLRWRKDKSAEEATTVQEIHDMYKMSTNK